MQHSSTWAGEAVGKDGVSSTVPGFSNLETATGRVILRRHNIFVMFAFHAKREINCFHVLNVTFQGMDFHLYFMYVCFTARTDEHTHIQVISFIFGLQADSEFTNLRKMLLDRF